MLKIKETTIGGFAVFSKQVAHLGDNTPIYKQRVDYIKSLVEVSVVLCV